MAKLQTKWIADNAVIDSKILLRNDSFLRGRNAADSADVNIVKVNASNEIEFAGSLNLGTFNVTNVGTVDGVDVSVLSTNVGNLVSLSGVAVDSTTLGIFTGTVIPDNQTVKQALQSLEIYSEATRSLVAKFEWQNSVASIVDEPVGGEAEGARYLVSATPSGDFIGHANEIATLEGASWSFLAATLGTFVSVDADNDGLYYFGGASWVKKYFEATTASTGLTKVGFDVRLADAAASGGIQVSSGAISAVVDGVTVEISSNAIAVKAGGIGETELNNVDGGVDAQSFILPTGYVAGAGVVAALDTIDAAVRKVDGNIAAVAADVLDLQGAVGADKVADIVYSSVNYVSSATSTIVAIGALDTQVKVNADAILALSAPKEELITVTAGMITDGHVDLAVEAVSNESVAVFVIGGLLQHKGVDYTLSVVSEKTRITFAGDLATLLEAGDILVVRYSA